MSTSTEWAYAGTRYRMYRFTPEVQRQLKDLNKADNWHVFLAWAEDVFWMALSVAVCVAGTYWLYPLAALVIGARQRGLSTLLHDCAHGVGVADRRLQMLAGTVMTAYPIFQQHYAYKVSHVYTHHPRLGSPDLDPDLRFFIEQGAYRSSATSAYVRRVVILPLLGSQTWAYLRYLVRNRYRVLKGEGGRAQAASPSPVQRRKRALDRAGFWLFWAAVVGLAWNGGWLLGLLLFWVVPYLTSFQILGWYIELSEHTPLVRDSNIDLYMTRNRKSRTWEKFLTGIHNDNYHLEHHLDPRTPFYNLHKARRVRLHDPGYAAVDRQLGGLFTTGPEGQPSAMSAIVRSMTRPAQAEAVAVNRKERDAAA
ncbi:fatty acid desaturase family protein [Actinacidiphila sp. ITFR-21]|uniref:fatty acid desaturase family protein n=1 Tax=Actinacidiphila sp. ITFR-21 TaxID=3075199 RepID=UPI00288C3870|nr:fatty acid desaturase family protein [Streptomyces sp. ITFR-21]WNI16791.1 fatty acid desaturase family protein [Streptomyces sp. ITFR-21]